MRTDRVIKADVKKALDPKIPDLRGIRELLALLIELKLDERKLDQEYLHGTEKLDINEVTDKTLNRLFGSSPLRKFEPELEEVEEAPKK